MKRDVSAEVTNKTLQFHSRTSRLQRVEDFDADDIDQIGQEHASGAIGVIEHVNTERPRQISHLSLARPQELPIQFEAQERAVLAAKIFSQVQQIDFPNTCVPDATVLFVEEIENVAKD